MTIRSLLEHVGAVRPGQRIYVDGREVDPPSRWSLIQEWMICSGCIRLKISPVHWILRLSGLCDGKGTWS
jgi:hypothetical protein